MINVEENYLIDPAWPIYFLRFRNCIQMIHSNVSPFISEWCPSENLNYFNLKTSLIPWRFGSASDRMWFPRNISSTKFGQLKRIWTFFDILTEILPWKGIIINPLDSVVVKWNISCTRKWNESLICYFNEEILSHFDHFNWL